MTPASSALRAADPHRGAEASPAARWIAVVGPTASGKSGLAVEVARRVGGEVVSTDSLQVYRHLDIGTAKPTEEERGGIPHHLIDVADPDEPYSAGRYVADARAAIAGIAARGRVPVLCGGTGLYFKALMRGLAPVPPVPDEVRREVLALAEREGLAACRAELARCDPESAARLPANDRARILRALEVFRATGRPLGEFQRAQPFRAPPAHVLSIGIRWPRADLRARIAARTRAMLDAGWIDEVRGLLARGYAPTLKPLQGIGYREIVQHLAGEREADGLAEAIALRTGQYAKRQETWFRRQPEIVWAEPGAQERLIEAAERFLG